MKVLSFDVGIKNMAYCFLDVSGEQINAILDWNVLNMMDDDNTPTIPCNCIKKKATLCGKVAKYEKHQTFYCDKHAKECGDYLLPSKQTTQQYLSTRKVDELFQLAIGLGIYSADMTKPKKVDMLSRLQTYYTERCFTPLKKKTTKLAGDTDLIEIGKNMRTLFDRIPIFAEATHVIIENQISTLATRMKTIQGMLAQYFILRNPDANIEFVSSINKLKGFIREPAPIQNTFTPAEQTSGQRYRDHKKDGIVYCSQILRQHPHLETWQQSLLTKKKDDLADCFLQGVWYSKSVLR